MSSLKDVAKVHDASAGRRPGATVRLHEAPIKLFRLGLALVCHAGVSYAAPFLANAEDDPEDGMPAEDAGMWAYLGTGIALVLLGGAFAGLTIALMGQDEIYLQVIATSGEGAERKHATKVLNLLKRGKHWVLVTLLVGNVITNETLPIVLDRSIGGGYAAAISSTVLVIIFGEIVPQSICVRFGLPIGAWCSRFVLVLMYVFAPITWPIAKLLDHLLGQDHGTTYKKAGLKTLVTLHKTMGEVGSERLNEDEVAIISGVLDLKAKSVGSIMTPMNDVFTLSANAVLDEDTMDEIMREGYSRIPVHHPKNENDFLGMLLVKMLITYDPEDGRVVSDFSLATLPETRPETSCLDIINFFQEGKSHMILVSDFPGQSHGALGVVTLEDVIEELIGEEIIDESDVFIDVHKAIRRMQPAPIHRAALREATAQNQSLRKAKSKDESLLETDEILINEEDGQPRSLPTLPTPRKRSSLTGMERNTSPKPTTFLMRRKSSNTSPHPMEPQRVQMRQYTPEMREHLRHLGPSNAASKPKPTRVNTVTIKPGVDSIPEDRKLKPEDKGPPARNITTPPPTSAQEGIGHDWITPGKDASDGVRAVSAGHGTMDLRNRSLQKDKAENTEESGQPRISSPVFYGEERAGSDANNGSGDVSKDHLFPQRQISHSNGGSVSPSRRSRHSLQHVHNARSGSITEQFVESGGIQKLVLEATSSGDEGDTRHASVSRENSGSTDEGGHNGETTTNDALTKNERRKRRRKNKHENNSSNPGAATRAPDDENTPLLSRNSG